VDLKRDTNGNSTSMLPCNTGSFFRTRASPTLSRCASSHRLSFDSSFSCSRFASVLPICRQARSDNEFNCVFVQVAPASLQDYLKELLSETRLEHVRTQRNLSKTSVSLPFPLRLRMLPLSFSSDSNRACKKNLVAPGIVEEPNLWIDAF
jgi:hypothetical protein